VWVATTTDPALASWDVQQLTNGERDAIGDVVSGNSAGNAFGLAWQEDPAGLQPGEAEGRGDGGRGATVSGGTDIWYTHSMSPSGAGLRANIAKLSNNNAQGTGQPGASRPNLRISGSTAVVAYEESACTGGNGGKCIVYHAFAYSRPDTNAAGVVLSDVTKNARRVRFVLQGTAAAGSSSLRTVVLWRESATVVPGAPADIIVRRGMVDAGARPGSTGHLASDVLADAPQNLTNVAASGGNANAHRAIVRGGLVVLAYDQTPDMNGADPKKTAKPTANYNLFVTRSDEQGNPGSWSGAVNLSHIDAPEWTVVEPRMVPTPGTVVNPLTGRPDVGDVQNPDIFYVSYATATNSLAAAAGRVYLSRTTDRGVNFEPFVPVSPTLAGQSEAQLRPLSDGSSATVLWMGEQTLGDAATKDAMFAVATAVERPNLTLTALGTSFAAGGQRTVNLTLQNQGGDARQVVLYGALPAGLSALGLSDPGACSLDATQFSCSYTELRAHASRTLSITVGSTTEGSYAVSASASSDGLDTDLGDNTVVFAVSVIAPVASPLPEPEPEPDPVPVDEGGGCAAAAGDRSAVDPTLLLLVGGGVLGMALRRIGRRPGPDPS
jgi:hypothetical protein